MLLAIYDQTFKITAFASFLHNNMKQKGYLCLCEGVQGSANSEFDLIMDAQSGCLLFSSAVAQQSSALPVPVQNSASDRGKNSQRVWIFFYL